MATHSSRVGSRNANTPPHEKKKSPEEVVVGLGIWSCYRADSACRVVVAITSHFGGGVRTLRTFLKMVSANENVVVVGGGGKKEHWERVYIYRAGSKLTLLADVRGRRRTTRSHHTPSNPHPHCKIPAVIITHEVHSDLLFRLKCLFTVNHINANLM